jgi:hypothetical protein
MKSFSLALIALSVLSPHASRGVTILFDTSSATGWTATGGGAVNVTPYVVANFGNYAYPVLSVTQFGNAPGAFLPGGSLANFSGFWIADYTFTLPGNAVNVQFNYSRFFADGRGVMKLNGTIIDSAGYPDGLGSLAGVMVFTEGGSPQPYTFNGPFGNVTGSVSSGFIAGGVNTIEFIMNNTADTVAGVMTGNLSPVDGTGLGISGVISYAVPEPASAGLLLSGAIGLWLFRRRN